MIALAVASGDVVHDRVAENVIVGALRFDVPAFLPDDERQLGLVVNAGSNVRVQLHDIVRPHHCACRLGEHRGMAVDFGSFHRSDLVAAVRELAGVVTIIFSDTEYIAVWNRDRRQQRDVGKRAGLRVAGRCISDFVDLFDGVEHVVDEGNRSNGCFASVDTTDLDGAIHSIASELHKFLWLVSSGGTRQACRHLGGEHQAASDRPLVSGSSSAAMMIKP